MDSALTLAPSANSTRAGIVAVLTALAVLACTSPTDLDVDRTKMYADGTIHPNRLSIYYYFGDSAYEGLVSDTSLLNSIWLEHGTTPHSITIPQFIFQLPDTVKATMINSPFARCFSFSAEREPMDALFRNSVGPLSYIEGEYYDQFLSLNPFHWMADTLGHQLRIAWTEVEGQNIAKGSVQIALADPTLPRYVTYRAIITLEY